MRTKCLLCLGTNTKPEVYLPAARRLLQETFPDIRFAPEETTLPVNFPLPTQFVNQMAVFTTARQMQEVNTQLKDIERKCGRTPEDKQRGCIKIDIDLMQYGDYRTKPNEMEREYIKRGIDFLFRQEERL